jgi:hypothetical protein
MPAGSDVDMVLVFVGAAEAGHGSLSVAKGRQLLARPPRYI